MPIKARCYCCGAAMAGYGSGFVCSTCKRDYEITFDETWKEKVRKALAGEAQVCLKCGWSLACHCKD